MAGDALRQFPPGQARHLDVGHQDVRLQLLQHPPCGFAVGGAAQYLDIRLQAQQRRQRTPYHRLVFGQQDADHAAPPGANDAGGNGVLAATSGTRTVSTVPSPRGD
ncbi:hypothetical protein G6F57_018572 [Rhizopus arrhizus]|nr:hypothetical protein G6F57_018572 [Rhizopus arrhizus]